MLSKSFNVLAVLFLATSAIVAQDYTTTIQLKWTEDVRQHQVTDDYTLHFLHFEDASYDAKSPQLPIFSKNIRLAAYGSLSAQLTDAKYAPLEESSSVDLSSIPASIAIKTRVTFAHKKPVGIIHLVPIRKTASGGYEKLISAKVELRLTPKSSPYASGAPRTTYATSSKLQDGTIYKIAVNNTGIHKIDYSFLQKLGIDVANVDPQKIQILGNGGRMLTERMDIPAPDDLAESAIYVEGESDGRFDQGDYILFYAEGTKNWSYNENTGVFSHSSNPYTDDSHYFIKIGTTNGKRISNRASVGTTSYSTTAYDHLAHHEIEETNLMEQEFALPPSGREWYGESFRIDRNRTFYFPFKNRVESEAVKIYPDVAVRAFQSGSVSVSMNGNLVSNQSSPTTTVYIYSDFAKKPASLNATSVIAGQNINVDVNFSNPESSAEMWLNYLSLHVRSNLNFDGGQMQFRDERSLGNSAATYQLSNAGNATIWDVTDPSNAVEQLTTTGNNPSFGADASILREFVAFDGSSFYTPTEVGPVANQNLHGIITPPDALFVCHSSLRTEADRLAAHRRSHSNMTVEVVNVEDIYNEFSSGNQDITAIRNFCRMLYSRETANEKFTHLLLFGIGSFDYKSLGKDRDAASNPNLVPLYQTPESLHPINTYTSDDYFALLDSSEQMKHTSLLDIAVGRLPAADLTEAAIYVDKIIAYETEPAYLADWKNRLCFVADDGDGNLHFDDAEGVSGTAAQEDSTYNIDKVYLDAYQQVSTSGGERYPDAKNAFLDALFKGTFIVNYLGHGGPDGWAQERVFTSSDISGLSNQTKLPLFITATCSFAPHDDPLSVSAGELLLLNPYGGAISLFTTVRVVVASSNERLVRQTLKVIFDKKANGERLTTGEVMQKAKNNAAISPPVNSRKYALLGDPTMKLSYPTYSVRTNQIDGQAITNSDTIRALQRVTISGEIVDNDGNPATNFNGIIYPTVFDKKDRLNTLGNDGDSYPDDFYLRKKIIFKGKASVTNGQFSFSFVVPKDINYIFGQGKVSYYAKDESNHTDASGYYNGIIVGGSAPNAVADNQGPQVLVYMNTEDFARGGMTNDKPNLLVKLYDENGINTVGNSIGHDLTGTLTPPSSQETKDYILNDFYESTQDDYTSGTAVYPLKDLEPGLHHIKVKAWDTYNNPGEGDTEFIVAETEDLALKHVLNYPNPFTTFTRFEFEHNYPYQELDVQVQVYTVSGRLVKTIQRTIAAENNSGYRIKDDITWDGLDDYGDRLGNGVYVYKVLVQAANSTEDGKQASEFQKLVILK